MNQDTSSRQSPRVEGTKVRTAARLLSLLFALLVAACAPDRRPDEHGAKQVFARLYPQAEIDSVWITEDEVVARSFKFTYRLRGQPSANSIEIQFMEGPDGSWVPAPPAPDSLP